MKKMIPVVVGSVAFGAALGWFLKPDRRAEPGTVAGQPAAGAPTGRETKTHDREEDLSTTTTKSRIRVETDKPTVDPLMAGQDAADEARTKAIEEKLMAAMRERQEKQDEAKIKEMVDKFGLSATQEASLRAHFAKRRERQEGLSSGADVDEFAKTELNDTQLALYEADKRAKVERSVESRALSDLATLNKVVELRPEQRDAVYEVLLRRAGEAKVDGVGVMEGTTIRMGGGLSAVVGSALGDDAAAHNRSIVIHTEKDGRSSGDFERQMKEQQQKAIDQKVSELTGILDERQLGQYRSHLETKGPLITFGTPAK